MGRRGEEVAEGGEGRAGRERAVEAVRDGGGEEEKKGKSQSKGRSSTVCRFYESPSPPPPPSPKSPSESPPTPATLHQRAKERRERAPREMGSDPRLQGAFSYLPRSAHLPPPSPLVLSAPTPVPRGNLLARRAGERRGDHSRSLAPAAPLSLLRRARTRTHFMSSRGCTKERSRTRPKPRPRRAHRRSTPAPPRLPPYPYHRPSPGDRPGASRTSIRSSPSLNPPFTAFSSASPPARRARPRFAPKVQEGVLRAQIADQSEQNPQTVRHGRSRGLPAARARRAAEGRAEAARAR